MAKIKNKEIIGYSDKLEKIRENHAK